MVRSSANNAAKLMNFTFGDDEDNDQPKRLSIRERLALKNQQSDPPTESSFESKAHGNPIRNYRLSREENDSDNTKRKVMRQDENGSFEIEVRERKFKNGEKENVILAVNRRNEIKKAITEINEENKEDDNNNSTNTISVTRSSRSDPKFGDKKTTSQSLITSQNLANEEGLSGKGLQTKDSGSNGHRLSSRTNRKIQNADECNERPSSRGGRSIRDADECNERPSSRGGRRREDADVDNERPSSRGGRRRGDFDVDNERPSSRGGRRRVNADENNERPSSTESRSRRDADVDNEHPSSKVNINNTYTDSTVANTAVEENKRDSKSVEQSNDKSKKTAIDIMRMIGHSDSQDVYSETTVVSTTVINGHMVEKHEDTGKIIHYKEQNNEVDTTIEKHVDLINVGSDTEIETESTTTITRPDGGVSTQTEKNFESPHHVDGGIHPQTSTKDKGDVIENIDHHYKRDNIRTREVKNVETGEVGPKGNDDDDGHDETDKTSVESKSENEQRKTEPTNSKENKPNRSGTNRNSWIKDKQTDIRGRFENQMRKDEKSYGKSSLDKNRPLSVEGFKSKFKSNSTVEKNYGTKTKSQMFEANQTNLKTENKNKLHIKTETENYGKKSQAEQIVVEEVSQAEQIVVEEAVNAKQIVVGEVAKAKQMVVEEAAKAKQIVVEEVAVEKNEEVVESANVDIKQKKDKNNLEEKNETQQHILKQNNKRSSSVIDFKSKFEQKNQQETVKTRPISVGNFKSKFEQFDKPVTVEFSKLKLKPVLNKSKPEISVEVLTANKSEHAGNCKPIIEEVKPGSENNCNTKFEKKTTVNRPIDSQNLKSNPERLKKPTVAVKDKKSEIKTRPDQPKECSDTTDLKNKNIEKVPKAGEIKKEITTFTKSTGHGLNKQEVKEVKITESKDDKGIHSEKVTTITETKTPTSKYTQKTIETKVGVQGGKSKSAPALSMDAKLKEKKKQQELAKKNAKQPVGRNAFKAQLEANAQLSICSKLFSKNANLNASTGDCGTNKASGNIEKLLKWIKKRINQYPAVNVTNFTSSWEDGIALCALMNYLLGDKAIDPLAVSTTDKKKNFEMALKAATEAGVPPLLEAEELATCELDRRSMITYLHLVYKVLFADKQTEQKTN